MAHQAQIGAGPAAPLVGSHLSGKVTKGRSPHIPCWPQHGDTPAQGRVTRTVPWPQQCQTHQRGWEPNNLQVTCWTYHGQIGEVRINFCMSQVVKQLPGISGKSLVRMFRVKPMQGTGPSHDHKAVLSQSSGSVPGAGLLAVWTAFHTSTQSRWGPLEIKDRLQLLHRNQQQGWRTSCRKEMHHLSGSRWPG